MRPKSQVNFSVIWTWVASANTPEYEKRCVLVVETSGEGGCARTRAI